MHHLMYFEILLSCDAAKKSGITRALFGKKRKPEGLLSITHWRRETIANPV